MSKSNTEKRIIRIYTDGSANQAGKTQAPGGWAYIILVKENGDNYFIAKKVGFDGEDNTTSQRMELTAIKEALLKANASYLKKPKDGQKKEQIVELFTDLKANAGILRKICKDSDGVCQIEKKEHLKQLEYENLDLLNKILETIRKIECKVDILTVEWIPGHTEKRMNDKSIDAKTKSDLIKLAVHFPFIGIVRYSNS